MRPVVIHLAGAGGKGNIGAESIVLAMVRLFRRALGPTRFFVSAWKPDRIRKILAQEPDIQAVEQEGLFPGLRGLLAVDAYVVCGDIALSETVVSFLPVYWAVKILPAWILGKKIIFFGIEAEALQRPSNRLAARLLGLTADLFVVRNRVSADNLAALGLPARKVVVGCEPALCLEASEILETNTSVPEKADSDRHGGLLVGFGIRDYFDAPFRFDPLRFRLVRRDAVRSVGHPRMETVIARLARMGRRLIEVHGARLVFVPHHFLPRAEQVIRPDADIARLVAEGIGHPDQVDILPEGLSPLQAMRVYRHCDLVLSMRHHATSFAVLGGATVLALDIGAKIRNFLREAGCADQLLDPLNAGDRECDLAVDRTVEQRVRIAGRLQEALAAMRQDMDQALGRVRELLAR